MFFLQVLGKFLPQIHKIKIRKFIDSIKAKYTIPNMNNTTQNSKDAISNIKSSIPNTNNAMYYVKTEIEPIFFGFFVLFDICKDKKYADSDKTVARYLTEMAALPL